MFHKNLELLVIGASKLSEAMTIVLQDLLLLDFHPLMYLIDQALDDNHTWIKMIIAKLRQGKCYYKQTPPKVSTRSDHLVDS